MKNKWVLDLASITSMLSTSLSSAGALVSALFPHGITPISGRSWDLVKSEVKQIIQIIVNDLDPS